MIMLEITDQLPLAPFIALSSIVAVLVAQLCSSQGGLYHALIHAAHLPYLPFDRPPEFDSSSFHEGSRAWIEPEMAQVHVSDVMAPSPEVLTLPMTKAEAGHILEQLTHNGFPVVAPSGELRGLLLRDELSRKDVRETTSISDVMDRAPCCVHAGWPIDRAHRLFSTMGLRHMVVTDQRTNKPVGIITRHDLLEPRPHGGLPRLSSCHTADNHTDSHTDIHIDPGSGGPSSSSGAASANDLESASAPMAPQVPPSAQLPPPGMGVPLDGVPTTLRHPPAGNALGRADALLERAETSRADADYEATLAHLRAGAGEEPELLWRLARACKDVATRTARGVADGKALKLEGLEAARRATRLGPDCFKSHLWLGIMLGQASDYVGIMEKLRGAFGIRDSFRRAAELEPADAESVHCLGQWYYSIAEMGASTWVARKGMASIGLKASFAEALGHFQAAALLKSPYLVNDLMVGKCHVALGQWAQAAAFLAKVESAWEQANADDQDARQTALRLLGMPQMASSGEGVASRARIGDAPEERGSGTAPLLVTSPPRQR